MTLWGGLSSGFKNLQDKLNEGQAQFEAYRSGDNDFPVGDMRRPAKVDDAEDMMLNDLLRNQFGAPPPPIRTGAAGGLMSIGGSSSSTNDGLTRNPSGTIRNGSAVGSIGGISLGGGPPMPQSMAGTSLSAPPMQPSMQGGGGLQAVAPPPTQPSMHASMENGSGLPLTGAERTSNPPLFGLSNGLSGGISFGNLSSNLNSVSGESALKSLGNDIGSTLTNVMARTSELAANGTSELTTPLPLFGSTLRDNSANITTTTADGNGLAKTQLVGGNGLANAEYLPGVDTTPTAAPKARDPLAPLRDMQSSSVSSGSKYGSRLEQPTGVADTNSNRSTGVASNVQPTGVTEIIKSASKDKTPPPPPPPPPPAVSASSASPPEGGLSSASLLGTPAPLVLGENRIDSPPDDGLSLLLGGNSDILQAVLGEQMKEAAMKAQEQDRVITQLQKQNQLFQDQLQQTNHMYAALQKRFKETEAQVAKQTAEDGRSHKQEAEHIRAAYEAFQTQVDAERKENQKQMKALELSSQHMQSRLDRQTQKMRDLETNYAEAQAPLQRRLVELEAASKTESWETTQKIEDLTQDLQKANERSGKREKEILSLQNELTQAHKVASEREEDLVRYKESEKLEVETLKLALQKLSQKYDKAMEEMPPPPVIVEKVDACTSPIERTGITPKTLWCDSTTAGGTPEKSDFAASEAGISEDAETIGLLKEQNSVLKQEIQKLRMRVDKLNTNTDEKNRNNIEEGKIRVSSAANASTSNARADRMNESACSAGSQNKKTREDELIDSWFQQDAVNLTLENDKLKGDLFTLNTRFEKALQVIGKLQQELEQFQGARKK